MSTFLQSTHPYQSLHHHCNMLQVVVLQAATCYCGFAIIDFIVLNPAKDIIGKPNSSERVLKSTVKAWSGVMDLILGSHEHFQEYGKWINKIWTSSAGWIDNFESHSSPMPALICYVKISYIIIMLYYLK